MKLVNAKFPRLNTNDIIEKRHVVLFSPYFNEAKS